MAIEIVSFPFKNGHFFLLRVMSTFTIGYISITIPVLSHYPMIIHIKKYDFPWFVVSVYHLVGGWPTPQKKIRVPQWGWWTSQWKNNPVMFQSPPKSPSNPHSTTIFPWFSYGFPTYATLHPAAFFGPRISIQGHRESMAPIVLTNAVGKIPGGAVGGLPSGKCLHKYGKSPCFMGKPW